MKKLLLSLGMLITLFPAFSQGRFSSHIVKAQVLSGQQRLQVQKTSKEAPRASSLNDFYFIESDAPASDSTCEKESSSRSKEGVTPVEFTLTNRTKITIVLYWLDYEGKRVKYEEVAPGYQIKQPTFLTHPWVVTDNKGRCLRVLTPPGDFVIQ